MPQQPDNWSKEDFFEPYIMHVLDCFGPKRCMNGADWPVFNSCKDCRIDNVFEIINNVVRKMFNDNQEIWNDIFYNNAVKTYKLI